VIAAGRSGKSEQYRSNKEKHGVTPDAVLHRYVELVSGERIDLGALYQVVSTDADLLGRWIESLGCAVEPDAIRAALRALTPDAVRGLAHGQLWSLTPLSSAARLGFDQWRSVLRAACLAEALAERIAYAPAEGARLRTLLAISGFTLRHDPLMRELAEFRGAAPLQLVDAHPLLRMFAVVEALEHQSEQAAANLTETLFRIEPAVFANLLETAGTTAEALVREARIRDDDNARWRERLWLHAQIMAFSNLIAGETDIAGIHTVGRYVTRSLFAQIPQCFLFDAERGALIGTGDDDLASLSISAMNSRSVVARALRERRLVEVEDAPSLPVSDRQIMRRLESERICAVPMVVDDARIGVLVFRQSDDDRGDAAVAMQAYAAELGRWLGARQRDEDQRRRLLEDYRARHEKRLREIVHEANNPLSIINNYLHVLELRLADHEGAREQLRLIGEEIRRATGIIARAVEFPAQAAVDAGERGPTPQRFDLNELVRNVIELIEGQATMQRVQIQRVLHGDGVFVVTDPDMVTQIVTNLVRNAVEAMPDGGTLTIETHNARLDRPDANWAIQPGPYAMLSIRDTGHGMDAATQARIFEPFFTTKGQGEGTGLGLAMVYGIIKQSGGHVWVTSKPDQGTTFTIYLPQVLAVEQQPATQPATRSTAKGGGETILLVDDEEALRSAARRALVRAGYRVIPAVDGPDALRVYMEHTGPPVALVVTDVVMPGLGGRELVGRLKSMSPSLRVLLVSGYTEEGVRKQGVLQPGTEFLEKPFTPEKLLKKIRQILDEPN
jgi:signal transduction histidine kinase/ActR/RegA family two-component response regulator